MTETTPEPLGVQLRDELAQQGVKYFFGAYVDLHGVPKSKCVPIEHLEAALAGSELYTVGALEGMGELGPNERPGLGVSVDEKVLTSLGEITQGAAGGTHRRPDGSLTHW